MNALNVLKENIVKEENPLLMEIAMRDTIVLYVQVEEISFLVLRVPTRTIQIFPMLHNVYLVLWAIIVHPGIIYYFKFNIIL